MSDIENEDYKENDIVWAKVKGYPWWPSLISQISYKSSTTLGKTSKEKIYTIELIGEKSDIKVSSEKIEPFTKNYDKHINTKNTSLLKSIEKAKKIYEKKAKKDKENEEQNKNNKENKDNDSNNKFLQKKRLNDRVILDEENNEEEKDIKMKNDEEQDNNVKSTPKNNIKINININLTTNTQHTVNYNSFQTQDVLNQNKIIPNNTNNNSNNKQSNKPNLPKFNSINYSALSPNEKTGNKNNNKKEKIFNTTNIDNNKENNKEKLQLQLKEEEEKSIKSLKKEKKNEEKKSEEKQEEINKNKKNGESIEENEGSDCEEDNEELILTNDIINESIQKILNCQIQISNISSQKIINKELTDLSEKFHEYFDKNKNDNNNCEIYYLSKDLIPVLMNLTYIKNTEIINKIYEIISFLNEKIILELFNLSQKDKSDLIESLNINNYVNKETEENNNNENCNLEEDNFKEGQNIIDLINKRATIKSGISDMHTIYSKRGRPPKKGSYNSELSSDIYSSKINEGIFSINNINNEKNYSEEFIKLISLKDKTKIESEFKEKIGDFFENIYDKNNGDLDIDIAKLRKNMCIKLYKIIKKKNPEINRDLLKKMIIYYEYKIRNSNKEKIYSCKVKELFEIIKDKLYDNEKLNIK